MNIQEEVCGAADTFVRLVKADDLHSADKEFEVLQALWSAHRARAYTRHLKEYAVGLEKKRAEEPSR